MRVDLERAPRRSVRSLALLVLLLALAPGAIALSSDGSDGSPADEPSEFREYDASSAAAAPPSRTLGLTDSMPLATREDKPEESLCDRHEEGHRRATTRGNELFKLGEFTAAEACYLAALRHKSDFPMALYGLGEVHSKFIEDTNRFQLAVDAYELAIKTWPQYVDARVALGDLFLKKKKKKRAQRAYKEAVEVAEKDPLAWEALGRFYLDDAVRDYAQASVTYRRAALLVPGGGTSPGLLLGLAEAARGAQKINECVEKADAASSLAPGFARARFVAGACRLLNGDAMKAVGDLRSAVVADPKVGVDAYEKLAAALVALGKKKEALEVLEQGVAAFADAEDAARTAMRSARDEAHRGGEL
jgi:tetratricopeptide (TPR) repeat protein